MLRSRRFALVAAVAVLGLAACGDAKPSTTAGKAPAVIHVGGVGGAAGAKPATANASIAVGDRMMAPYGQITYVFDGTFPDLGSSAAAWTLPTNPQIDQARLSAIAAALGITDTAVRAVPAEQGGGWQLGSADYTGPSLAAGTDAMGSWWFNSGPTTDANVAAACGVTDPVAVDASGATVAPPPTTVECPVPQPPANVPTKDDALARAKQQFQAMGYDTAAYDWDTYADEWSASVTGYLLLGGHRSPLTVSMGFGGEGVVSYASGHLASPQAAGDYPTVDGATALARLNDTTGKWGWFGGPMVMARGGVAIDAVATGAASSGSAGSGGAAVTPTPQALPPDTSTASAPVEPGAPAATMPIVPTGDTMPAPEPITITLSTVKADLTTVWAEDGTVFILPAYTFGSADGGAYTIVAVDETYLDMPEPAVIDPTVVEPMPVETAPAVAPEVTTEQAAVLVGLTLDEATAAAEANGWLVRVSTLDGASQPLTMDFLSNRVNVSVQAGTVVAIDNVG